MTALDGLLYSLFLRSFSTSGETGFCLSPSLPYFPKILSSSLLFLFFLRSFSHLRAKQIFDNHLLDLILPKFCLLASSSCSVNLFTLRSFLHSFYHLRAKHVFANTLQTFWPTFPGRLREIKALVNQIRGIFPLAQSNLS